MRRRVWTSEPLLHNGHVLSVSSLLTSVLGGGFWVLATRVYDPATIGRNYAAVSAMMLLAGVGQLNLTNVLVRFVPGSARGARTFVVRAYLAALGTTLVMATGFVLLIPYVAPKLAFLHHPLLGVCFIVATAGYAVFVLQDGALTGLRRPEWVVVDNAVFSLSKIALIALFAVVIVPNGILASWCLALAVACAVTNTFLFTRAIPRHERSTSQHSTAGTRTPILGYIACDYVGALFWIAATTLPALIVLDLLDASQAAYFSLAWVIAYMLYLFSANMGSSLIVESVTDPERLARNCRRVMRHTGVLLLGCVLLLVAVAPQMLNVFGPEYARHGTVLLRLLLLSALPNLVVATAVSVCRARRRMRVVIGVLATVCCLVLALMVLLLPVMGIAGAGAAWLIGESAVAAGLLWRKAIWLGPDAVRPARAPRMPATAIARAAGERLEQLMAWPADRQLSRRLVREAPVECAPEIQRVSRTLSGLLLVHVDGGESLALKHPITERACVTLQRHCENVRTLASDEQLGQWRQLLPRVVSCDLRGRLPLASEQWMPGIQASALIHSRPEAGTRVAGLALAAIEELHRLTGRVETIGADHLHRWVDTPIAALRRDLPLCREGWGAEALDALRNRLCATFSGQQILVAWTHGDYSPDNVLVGEDLNQVSGIVDWATARPDGPAPADRCLFLLALRRELTSCELGDLVVRAVTGSGTDGVEENALLLLTWLLHVADNTAKSTRYHHSWLWLARNVVPVLQAVSG